MKHLTHLVQQNWKAALAVSLINTPLSVSLAVASGATPLQGIITGIWGPLIAAMFCGSRHNIFGVAGALTSIVLTFVVTLGSDGVALIPMLALFSGVMTLAIYFLGITKYLTLIPTSVLHGFLASVGISIALSQLNGALGLNDPLLSIPQHKELYLNVKKTFTHIASTNFASLVMFLISLVVLIISKKRFPNFPSVIAVSVIGIVVWIFSFHGLLPDVLLLGEKFPGLSFSIAQFPNSWVLLGDIAILKIVFLASITVTIVAVIETLISAKIAEKMTKKKFDQDREILGLSISNIGTGILWGLPVSAVFIRTALNIKSGGTHQMSGWLVGIYTLLLSAVLYNNLIVYFPFPVISAILMNIALGLIEIRSLKKIYFLEKNAFYIMLLTTILAVFEDPLIGILAGTVCALLIFLKRFHHTDTSVNVFQHGKFARKTTLKEYVHTQAKGDTIIIKLPWGVNYLTTDNFMALISMLDAPSKVLFSFSGTGDIDVDGVEMIEECVALLREQNIPAYFTGISEDTKEMLEKTGVYQQKMEMWRVFESTSVALEKIG